MMLYSNVLQVVMVRYSVVSLCCVLCLQINFLEE